MEAFNNYRFPRGESPGRPDISGREAQMQESSKRQQCGRATELAKRTGLEERCAGLPLRTHGVIREAGSGKVFDESGRKTVIEVPGGEVSWKTCRPCLGHAGCFIHCELIQRKESGGKYYAGR